MSGLAEAAPAAAEAGAAEPPRLELRGLRFAYGARPVLQGLDLEVRAGEVFGLLGPNGSGKSTALGVLSGLLPRQGGQVLWDGRALPGSTPEWRAAIGVVFQSPALDPKLTARQNLRLAARLQGHGGAELARRAERGLELSGLAARADDLVAEFSGGMKRRLDLARALLHEPRLLLMDEPTAGLDEAAFRESWERLDAMRRGTGLTILVATHRPDEAARCDRLAVVSEGRVATVRTPEELRSEVGHDVLVLRGRDPEALRVELSEALSLSGLVDGSDLLVDVERGHEWIPRIVEALPEGRLDAVALRRPTLADAFFRVVGTRLDAEPAAPAPARRRGLFGRRPRP